MGTLRRLVCLSVLLTLALTAGAAVTSKLVMTLEDTKQGGSFGLEVAGIGDVNLDGYGDLMTADRSHQIDTGPNSHAIVGRLIVLSGKDGKVIKEIIGDNSNSSKLRLATPFDRAGDVNKDGYPDYIAGAPDLGNFPKIGSAFICSGKDFTVLHKVDGEGQYDRFGAAVATAGDVNQDGYDDVIVGAPENVEDESEGNGRAYVFSGKDGSELYAYEGPNKYNQFGIAVGGGVDLNDDGYDDFFVGAPEWEAPTNVFQAGLVRAYSGKTGALLWDAKGDGQGYRLGTSVDEVPDLNGDGYDDVVAGAPYGRTNSISRGYAKVLSGKDGKVLLTLRPDADGLNSRFGTVLECIGDADGDDIPDFLVGAPYDSKVERDSGAVYVLSGDTGDILYTHRGTEKFQRFGRDLAGIGDINRDGLADYAVVNGFPRKILVYASQGPSGTIQIEEGASHTDSRAVTLGFTWDDPTGTIDSMRVRDARGAWDAWLTPAATKSWTLPTGDGEKTVEVQFQNGDDVESKVFSATIYLDETAPSGTITLDHGADYTAVTLVPLALSGTDLQSGLDAMRLKNDDGEWEPWQTVATSLTRELSPGDGLKTVTVQYRDLAGNLSTPAADTIYLDETAPAGSLTINGGAAFTASRVVSLALSLTEVGSGLSETRIRESTETAPGTWNAWEPYAAARSWTVAEDDGVKVIEVEVRDGVGNVSNVISSRITLDQTKPTCSAFGINTNAPYVAPMDTMKFGSFLTDKLEGSGPAEFRATFDGGNTWTDWIGAFEGFQRTTVPLPVIAGLRTAQIEVRDGVGNVSDTYGRPVYLIESNLPSTGGKGKVKGRISSTSDVDAFAVHMVKGDQLAVKLKGKAEEKKKEFVLALDLIASDGTRLIEGRYPADAKKVSVKGFFASKTDRYILVVRRTAASTTDKGTYSLSMTVKPAKANKKSSGDATGDVVTFDAVDGAVLKATLSGDGLTSTGVTLTGPDGDIPFAPAEGKNKITLKSIPLTAGTGTYRITLPAGSGVSFKWSLKPPPKLKATNSD